ncbi:hypothetical protein ACTFIR_011839 [Dictyostelium discoideum]
MNERRHGFEQPEQDQTSLTTLNKMNTKRFRAIIKPYQNKNISTSKFKQDRFKQQKEKEKLEKDQQHVPNKRQYQVLLAIDDTEAYHSVPAASFNHHHHFYQ